MRYFAGRKSLALAGEWIPANSEIQTELWDKLSVRVQKSLLNSGFVLAVLDNPSPVVVAGKVVLKGDTIAAGQQIKMSVWQSLSKKLRHALQYTGRVHMVEVVDPQPAVKLETKPTILHLNRNKHRSKQ